MTQPYAPQDSLLPDRLAALVVRPLWPLLAVMTAGPVLAWPWYLFNAWVVGARGLGRMAAIALMGALLLVLMSGVWGWLLAEDILQPNMLPYALIAITGVKVLVSYLLHRAQDSAFTLHVYHGGAVVSGAVPLVFGILLSALWLRETLPPLAVLVLLP